MNSYTALLNLFFLIASIVIPIALIIYYLRISKIQKAKITMFNSDKNNRDANDLAKNDSVLYQKILALPKESRCIASQSTDGKPPTNNIVLGANKNEQYGWTEFAEIVDPTPEIEFYIGSTHFDLFEAYVNSSFPAKANTLFVGHSTDNYIPSEPTEIYPDYPYDYSLITKILSKGSYPNLKKFSLGVSELFYNGCGHSGAIGEVTELLEKMPNIDDLLLNGSFSLTKPLNLPKLKELEISIVGMIDNELSEAPSQETFLNLFKSNLPAIEKLIIDFDCDGDFESGLSYSFPEEFLNGQSMPNLNVLEIAGLFKSGEMEALKESAIFETCKHIDHDEARERPETCYLAIDVHYEGETAFVAGLTFSDPTQKEPDHIYYSELAAPGEYKSGEFYKRELPCIIKLIEENNLFPSVIIIDGFTYLDDERNQGLGARLEGYFSAQDKYVGVIGVAKNPRKETPKSWEVLRGSSAKPLYVKAAGMNDDFARKVISEMHGEYRHPTLLKLVDQLCREKALPVEAI